ncbi:PulJ/GspJ family protein [Neptunicella sp. SCSIO 80796]|uniref:PulJ/GspJ family protein n=1 Tax=Neptunicella plasticusilytica TaxID=3117012 RepID=UPI003A4E1CED
MNRTERGFSLIEAMVALVILSLVFTSVWGWFATATNSTRRIEQALSLPEVFSQFVVHLELEDLQTQRSGRFRIGQYEVQWQATIEKRSDQQDYRRQPAWIVALFDVKATVNENGQFVSEFQTKALKQWRDPNYIEMPNF